MTSSLTETFVVIVICALAAQSAATDIAETAKPGFVLLNAACKTKALTLLDNENLPWKYFRVNQTSPGNYAIVLNQTLGPAQPSTNCLPKEAWHRQGRYTCDRNERFDIIAVVPALNNFSPTFCTKTSGSCSNITSASAIVKEGEADVGHEIAKIKLCDMDVFKTTNTYPTISITDTHFKSVNQGEEHFDIQLVKPFTYDADNPQQHTTITVSDGTHKAYSLDFIINVTDVDDQGPEFSQKVYHCNVSEGDYPGLVSPVCVVHAEDKDKGLNATIGYKVLNKVTGGVTFSITDAGSIEIHGKLDRETLASYIVPVMGFQQNRPADRFDIATVVITVTDIDDHPPVFTTPSATLSIMENTQNGAVIYQFTATDQDEGTNAAFTYRLEDNLRAFAIDKDSGKVTVKNSTKLDRESEPGDISIRAFADPSGVVSSTNPNATVVITLLDVNDNTPKLTAIAYNKTISKNESVGARVLALTASDPDKGANGNIKFSLIDDDTPFNISIAGEIHLKSKISERFKNVYHLVVKAEDQAVNPADRRSSSAPVTINVLDVNMHPPVASILNQRAVSEDATPETPVAWLNVTDMDPTDTINVTIVSGNGGGDFKIEHSYLSLYTVKVKVPLDRETTPFYRLNIRCSDSLHSTPLEVNITILDENDNPPIFGAPNSFTTTENNPANSVIGTLTATDADTGVNANVSFYIDKESQWTSNFTIDKTNGAITTSTSLDREALGAGETLQFIVYTVDQGHIPLTGSTTVTVTVQDLNDNPPVFEQAKVTLTVKELQAPGLIHIAKASDKDLGINKKINYIIASITPPSSDLFEISSSDGRLTTKRHITFADSNLGIIRLVIQARNPGDEQVPAKQDVTIHIDDVNNNVPWFGLPKYSATITEAMQPGTSIIRINATDADVLPINNKVTYWLGGTHNDTFRIDTSSGDVYLVKNIDLDRPGAIIKYSLKVFASDNRPFYNGSNALTVLVPFDVSVSYVNEYDPDFSRVVYICSVNETYTGTFGCTVHASDKDTGMDGNITYRILNNYQDKLAIDTVSGKLRVESPLNYDHSADRNFQLNVSATDGGSPSRTSYSTINIKVNRVNSIAPRIGWSTRNHLQVVEGAQYKKGTRIAVISVIDGDGNDGKPLSYTLDPDSSQFFLIRRHEGVISLKNSITFDYETKSSYVLEMSVKDDVHPAVKMNITLDVIPMNEFQPVITSKLFSVTEGTSKTVQISAYDNDSGADGDIVAFRIADATMRDNVSITADGNLTITNLDREVLGEDGLFTVPVTAVDGGNLTTTKDIKIKVTGINDNPPYFLDREKKIELNVNEKTLYSDLFTSMAKDDDIGEGSTIMYRLKKGDSSTFSVTQGGVVSIKSTALSATNRSVTIEIEAYNPFKPERTASQSIKLTIKDINDNAPIFVKQKYGVSVNECMTVGVVVETVSATDADINLEYRTITYWMDNTTDAFSVDAKSGQVYLRRQLDYDSSPADRTVHITVYATDLLDKTLTKSNHTANASMTVHVTSCNDNTPIFSQEVYFCSVNESYIGIFGCSVSATDKDADKDGDIAYQIVDKTKVTVDKTSGQLRINSSFNYDNPAEREIVVNVSATDGGSPPRSSFSTVRIQVKQVNKRAPNITWDSAKHLSVIEGATLPGGTQIGAIPVTDDDGNDGKPLIYTLDNDSKTLFTINDGVLSLKRDFAFDFEKKSIYALEMSVKDDVHPVVKKNITIDVINVNEFQPIITSRNFNVTEGSTKTVRILATDADFRQYGYVTFRLSNNTIHNVTLTAAGKLTITNLDREVLGEDGVFTVPVTAVDGGNLTTTADIKIKVTGINDNTPYFLDRENHIERTVNEKTLYSDVFTSVAYDDDIGVGQNISYRLDKGDKSIFRVNASGSLSIISTKLTAADRSVDLKVAAYNAGTPALKAVQTITLTIEDINDQPPRFDKPKYNITVDECQRIGSVVETVHATDADINLEYRTITYWMASTTDKFSVNAKTGQIQLTGQLDYEDPIDRKITFIVYATDLLNQTLTTSPNTTQTEVTVNIANCNDNAPKFTQGLYSCTLDESQKGAFGCTVRATDADKLAPVAYSISGNAGGFSISTTGGLTLAKEKDYDIPGSRKQFLLTVTASDGKFNSSTTVLIDLKNDNDNAPTFSSQEYTFSVTENVDMGHIGEVAATDKDGDSIAYSSGTTSCTDLTISGNGTVLLRRPLNYESVRSCSLTVYANDSVHSPSAVVRLDVVDANDNYPQFTKTYDIRVNETKATNKRIVQVNATDADGSGQNNKITYSILGSNTGDTFQIDATTGWIAATKPLDASVRQAYSLLVEASDNGTPALSNVTAVSVFVEDINDNKPTFLYTPYTAQITENSTEQVLFEVVARDADPDAKLTLSILSNPYSNLFFFNGTYFCATAMDAEQIKKDVISVTIEVSDGRFKANTSVSIAITDINDNIPYFLNSSPINIDLSDTTLLGTKVENITAIDKDFTNSEVMYILSYNFGFFEIDRTSGIITLQRTLDVHKYNKVDLTVTAIDSGSPPKSATTNINITVVETNKYTPTFINASKNNDVFEINFVEDKAGQTHVISANDNDTGPAGVISYSIKSPIGKVPDSFIFDTKTGKISLIRPIDFETGNKRDFTFLILAKDNATFSKSATATAVIHITDKDESPKFAAVTDIVYKELNASAGSTITTVTVTDPDVSEHFRNFTFTILPEPNEYFKIERLVGESDKAIVKAAKTLSKSGTYNITVKVTDGGGLSDTAKLTIQVSNITGFELKTNISEGSSPPVVLTNLLDAAHLSSDTWFSLVKSNDSSNFRVLKNGSFVAIRAFDREIEPEFKVEIKGNKNLSGEVILTAQIQMHVTVLDVNDETPAFNSSSYSIAISENTPRGTTLTSVTARDKDENPTLRYLVNPPSATFGIDPSQGEIYLKHTVDYESKPNNYSLTVVCNDTLHTANATIIITVTDENDVKPKFTNTSYTFRISESQPLGLIQDMFVNATDPDTDDNGKLTYSVLTDGSPVSLDASGQLRLKTLLDYDTMGTNKQVVVTAQVVDTAGHKDNATITIIVLDANNNAPYFTQPVYYYRVSEGALVLGHNISVQASDKDSGNNSHIKFCLKGANQTLFSIVTEDPKGYIHINHALDRESLSGDHDVNGSAVYTLTVLATDHGDKPQTASALVHITVDDVNDCPPVFPSSNLAASVQEGTAIGTTIMTVTTSDCDLLQEYKQVTYSFANGPSDAFNITSTGDIILRKAVSVQEQANYQLEIIATDGLLKSKPADLVITILDANDHSPNFTQPVYRFSVSENVAGVQVGQVLAVDEDPGENGNVTYAITSGNTGDVFEIEKVNSSGIVTVIASLDRETIPSYTLIVTAEDSASTGSRQGTCTVIVQVEDVNDNSPEFGQRGGYEGYVKEDATNNTRVKLNVPISAADSDNENNGTAGIIYSILPVDQSQFCINDTTGAVTVCGALDRETTEGYSLKVVARDSLGDADCRNVSANLTIIVTDVNDNVPVFVSTPYTYSVPENATSGTAVGTITVTDDDKHGLQAVRIRIANGSHENFYIDTTQNETVLIGTIFVSGVLDREDRSSYKLLVVANDAGRDASNAIVDIDIMDVNDNSPQFNESHIEVSVVEGSKPGVVYTIAAYDLDAPNTNNSDVVFQFDQETITEFENYFGIGKNGSIFTKQELDRENKNSSTCSLTVIASDKGRPPRQASVTVTVHVLDVNDNSPKFCDTPLCTMNSYVVETQPVGSIIALPVATDPDKGENGTILYSILTSPASKYFSIDSDTGLVTIAQPILINTLVGEGIVNDTTGTNETVTVKITVVASDKGPAGGRQSNLTVMVRIEPINDNAPRFKDLCDFHITEERPSGSFVGDCEAIIPNATYSHLAYTLITGFDNSLFKINTLNGTIRTTAVLDREVTSHYSLSVQVRDGRTPERTAFAAVTITVDDINDNYPEFLRGSFSLEIPENSTMWSRTINASAADPDEGQNGRLEYNIDNNYDGKFHINNTSGIVTVNGTFDYEQMTNYSFHVYASDNGTTPLTSSVLVTIAVLDVNDNAPMFHDVSAKYDVMENQTGTMFTLNATDKDSGYNGRVIYSITDADGGPFSIAPFDGRVFVDGHLDYETKSLYHLTFEAKDQGLNPLSTVINVTVVVKDVYDYVPMFPKDVYEVNVNASVAVGTKVIDLSIGRKGIEYHIAGSDSGLFSIDPASGVVTIRRPLGSHNRQDLVTVAATDGRGQTAETTLIVHINNHEVLFPEEEIEVRLPENFNESTLLLDLNTTEELSGQHVLYSIAQIEPDVQGVFRIEPQTGEVYCDKALDREVHGEYVIHIAAIVASSNRARRQVKDWSSTMQLRVHIDDENDNRPVFNASQQTLFGVPADAKANYLLAVLHAYDPDLGANGRVFYTATGGNTTVFGVDRNTGTVTTLVAIASLPGAQKFSLSVTADDGSGEPGPNSTLELQILAVPRIDRLMLQINMSTSQFRQKQALFIGNMSKLLGVDVQLESIESHREKTDSGTRLDLARTDMFFHGVNKTTGMIVPFDVMMGLINRKQEDLRALFGNQALEVTQVKMAPHDDPSAITVPIIALFCVAIFIFLGSFIAVVLTLYSWTRMNKQRELLEKRRQARDVKMSDFEMNSLRSRASKRGGAGEPAGGGAGAVNPVFLETEFVARKEKPAEKKITYETQELCLQFAEEPLRFSSELMTTNGNGNGARSVADSVLENTSLTSNDQLRSEASCRPNGTAETNGDVLTGPQMGLDGATVNGDALNANGFGLKAGEGPMMTSSPRISKDYDAEGKIAILGQGATNRLAAPNLRLSMERLDDMDKSRETDTDADLVDDKDGSKVADEDVKTTPRDSFESSSKKTAPDPATLSSKEETSSRPGSYAAQADREPAKVIEEQIYSEVDDVEVTSF